VFRHRSFSPVYGLARSTWVVGTYKECIYDPLDPARTFEEVSSREMTISIGPKSHQVVKISYGKIVHDPRKLCTGFSEDIPKILSAEYLQ